MDFVWAVCQLRLKKNIKRLTWKILSIEMHDGIVCCKAGDSYGIPYAIDEQDINAHDWVPCEESKNV